MALVAVKDKYHVVIPRNVRKKIGLSIGDLLEAGVERGKITFTPQSAVDRGIAESLADFKAGRTFGPFGTPEALIASLHRESRRLRVPKRVRRPARP